MSNIFCWTALQHRVKIQNCSSSQWLAGYETRLGKLYFRTNRSFSRQNSILHFVLKCKIELSPALLWPCSFSPSDPSDHLTLPSPPPPPRLWLLITSIPGRSLRLGGRPPLLRPRVMFLLGWWTDTHLVQMEAVTDAFREKWPKRMPVSTYGRLKEAECDEGWEPLLATKQHLQLTCFL